MDRPNSRATSHNYISNIDKIWPLVLSEALKKVVVILLFRNKVCRMGLGTIF